MEKKMPQVVKKVFLCLTEIFCQKSPNNFQAELVPKMFQNAARLVFEMPLFLKFGFIWGIRLFEWGPFFWGFKFLPFSRLSLDKKMKYVLSWENSRFQFKRDFFKALRALILLSYYNEANVYESVGYFPSAHIKEKIELREKLLRESSL